MESWIHLVETVLEMSLDWGFLGYVFFFKFSDQCSKHEFVIEDCVDWKGAEAAHGQLSRRKTGNIIQ